MIFLFSWFLDFVSEFRISLLVGWPNNSDRVLSRLKVACVEGVHNSYRFAVDSMTLLLKPYRKPQLILKASTTHTSTA
jgi:hypothetical protein